MDLTPEPSTSYMDYRDNEQKRDEDHQSSTSPSGKRPVNSSKRAAQNRAAQRAFRQRRDQYIKSLERKAETCDRNQLLLRQYHHRILVLEHENFYMRKCLGYPTENLTGRLVSDIVSLTSTYPPRLISAPPEVEVDLTRSNSGPRYTAPLPPPQPSPAARIPSTGIPPPSPGPHQPPPPAQSQQPETMGPLLPQPPHPPPPQQQQQQQQQQLVTNLHNSPMDRTNNSDRMAYHIRQQQHYPGELSPNKRRRQETTSIHQQVQPVTGFTTPMSVSGSKGVADQDVPPLSSPIPQNGRCSYPPPLPQPPPSHGGSNANYADTHLGRQHLAFSSKKGLDKLANAVSVNEKARMDLESYKAKQQGWYQHDNGPWDEKRRQQQQQQQHYDQEYQRYTPQNQRHHHHASLGGGEKFRNVMVPTAAAAVPGSIAVHSADVTKAAGQGDTSNDSPRALGDNHRRQASEQQQQLHAGILPPSQPRLVKDESPNKLPPISQLKLPPGAQTPHHPGPESSGRSPLYHKTIGNSGGESSMLLPSQGGARGDNNNSNNSNNSVISSARGVNVRRPWE